MNHRRPSAAARTSAAGTAAALVVGWLAAAVFLNQLLLRLQLALGTVGAYAAIICIVMLAAAGYTLLGRRFASLDEPEQSCTANAVEHAVDNVDAQVAALVRSGVDEEAARGLIRDMLVRAATPRAGGNPIEELLKQARGATKGDTAEAQHASAGGQYL